MKKTTIILVDDEVLIRKGIKSILELEDNFTVIEEFCNGKLLLDYIDSACVLPDLILMDIKMPEINGILATKQLIIENPNLKIIALSSFNSEIFVSNMLKSGAVCYIPKSTAPDKMINQIYKVLEN